MNGKQEYWNKSQLNYMKDILPSNYVKHFEAKIESNSKILDIGGARGNDSNYLFEKGHQPTVMDISNIAEEIAQKRNSKIPYIVHDISNTPYPFENHSFDYIYSRLAIQYFNKEQTIKIYKEINRLLKPNGEAHIIVKSIKDEKEMKKLEDYIKLEPGVYKRNQEIVSRFNWLQIQQILNAAQIENYTLIDKEEILTSNNKYGHKELLVTEIIIKQSPTPTLKHLSKSNSPTPSSQILSHI